MHRHWIGEHNAASHRFIVVFDHYCTSVQGFSAEIHVSVGSRLGRVFNLVPRDHRVPCTLGNVRIYTDLCLKRKT
jgi:hypothetical protein